MSWRTIYGLAAAFALSCSYLPRIVRAVMAYAADRPVTDLLPIAIILLMLAPFFAWVLYDARKWDRGY